MAEDTWDVFISYARVDADWVRVLAQNLEEIDFMVKKGRHDPCVGVRAGVTLESRMAIELMNAVLMHQAQSLDRQNFELF